MFSKFLKDRVKFNRLELAGSFGDIGTDFPLLVGMILACGLDPTSVLVMFGLMQIFTGLTYGIPMPVQPLKAMAVIMITQKLSGSILFGAGLAIGIVMLLLVLTGLISWIAKTVPKCVIRGIQLGLGFQLASLALKDYLPAEGGAGFALGFVAFAAVIFLFKNKHYPAALFVILVGFLYAIFFKVNWLILPQGVGFKLPHIHVPTMGDILSGFILLALPQIPLSLGNSILATKQISQDLFPEKKLSVRKIGFTYALMNLVVPFFSGVPVCHGSGGMAGHYTFGARSGGSVVIYGGIYLTLGLFFGGAFGQAIGFFPKPILGIILLFEALALMKFIYDIKNKEEWMIAFLVAVAAVGLPYGYIVGLVIGTLLFFLGSKRVIDIS